MTDRTLVFADYCEGLADDIDRTHLTQNLRYSAAELRRLHAQCDALLEALREIGEYTGEGPVYTTPWQDIVRSLGEKARAAIKTVEGEKT